MEVSTATQGAAFAPPPSGAHRALCYRFVDLGTQKIEYQGEVKHQRKVMLSFELVDEHDEFEIDGKKIKAPFTVHQRFTWSMHEKGKLRPFLESWRGRAFADGDLKPGGFDTKNLIGVPCMLNVIHATRDGRTYANISGVSPLPARLKEDMPALHNPRCYVALEKERFNKDAYDTLSERVREAIEQSPEWKRLNGIEAGEPQRESFTRDDIDDDIPFNCGG